MTEGVTYSSGNPQSGSPPTTPDQIGFPLVKAKSPPQDGLKVFGGAQFPEGGSHLGSYMQDGSGDGAEAPASPGMVEPEIWPTQLGLRYQPPMLVIQYMKVVESGMPSERAVHKVPLDFGKVLRYKTKDLIAALRRHARHASFLLNVEDEQLKNLLRRLRAAVKAVDAAEPDKGGAPHASMSRSHSQPQRTVEPEKPGVSTSAHRSSDEPKKAKGRPGRDGKRGAETKKGNWPSNAWTHWSFSAKSCTTSETQLEAPSSPTAGLKEAFESFRTSRGTDGIAESFARLLRDSWSAIAATKGAKDGAQGFEARFLDGMVAPPLETIRTAVGTQQRLARVLWELLEARQTSKDYLGLPLAGKRAVVVGAGPTGLRCALDLRLLGAEVVVVERRVQFERINRLHLWKWVGEDLKGWGAKVLEPPELSFGANPDFLHIGIAELQMLLLKPALLLGVQVFFGAEFRGAQPGADDAWEVNVASIDQDAPGPKFPAAGLLIGVSILVGADGPRGAVASALAMPVQETNGLRKEAALGLVVNFANGQSAAEKGRRPFSLARQFYESLFTECEQQTGLALENIVCYIASQTHYFVMTPTRKSLVSAGIVSADAPDGKLLASLNQARLAEVVREVAAFRWRTEDPAMPLEALDRPVGPPALFDFSKTRRASAGLRVLEAPSSTGAETTSRLLVGLCGDALIEPFWPEGLGIVRGFFGAMDLASSCKVWSETGDAEAAVSHFESAFSQLKSLAGKTRAAVLKPDDKTFGLDPSSRYRFAAGAGAIRRASSAPAGPRAKP
mmetsp:Transcript_100650/g.270430  ORF Transcript_100650/g.270430 Transcript_100650/m.270430 type:complete len:787 (-) Transcript_100650:79-2439(-)